MLGDEPAQERPRASSADLFDASTVLSTALGIARANDQIGWSQLEDRLRREFVERLHAWRSTYEQQPLDDSDREGRFSIADGLLDLVMGRLVFALAGVYSNNPAFIDQRHVIEDLFSVPDWSIGGTTAIVEAPRGLVFLLHYVHGALCLARRQPELALRFAQVTVAGRQPNQTGPLWVVHDLIGWPKLLGPSSSTWAWEYLCSMRQRQAILERLFALQADYDVGLAAYSMMLSLRDLAACAAAATPTDLTNPNAIALSVPPLFVSMPHETIVTASRRTFGNRQMIEDIAKRAGAQLDTMRQLWPSWKRLIVKFGRDIFRHESYFVDDVPLGNLA